MKKLAIILLLLLLLSPTSYVFAADYTTTNYGLIVPAEGSRDWLEKISNDIITIDRVLGFVSGDAAWINFGSYTYLRDADNVGIGTSAPDFHLQVIGDISGDTVRLKTLKTGSPDVTTVKGACLAVSLDTAGVVRLIFYDGSNWRNVTIS